MRVVRNRGDRGSFCPSPDGEPSAIGRRARCSRGFEQFWRTTSWTAVSKTLPRRGADDLLRFRTNAMGTRSAIVASLLCSLATALACWTILRTGKVDDPRIDGSSQISFDASVDAVRRSLPDSFRAISASVGAKDFVQSYIDDIAEDAQRQSKATSDADPGQAARLVRARMHGKNWGDMLLDMVGRAKMRAAESSALFALKQIAFAQSQCAASGAIDVNGNGQGEFGFFGELAGAVNVRGGEQRLSPPLLGSAFGNVIASQVSKAGYVFQIWLPSAESLGVTEQPAGGDAANALGVHPGSAEILWCCYAWPMDDVSGSRTFFVSQSGDILATDNGGHYAAKKSPAFNAAYCGSRMDSPIAANKKGVDGMFWYVVQF